MKASRWHSCTVLSAMPVGRQLWQFGAGRDKVMPGPVHSVPVGKPFPPNVVRKSWQTLLQPRVNIAWLPAADVFLRVLQLPAGDPAELPGMVEFQLEKISPLPQAQIVWTVEAIPHADGKQQTAIIALVRRTAIEEFLGNLEQDGFIADQLEIPFLRELRSYPAVAEGLWVFLRAEADRIYALSAWWSGGVLMELNLSTLPSGPAGPILLAEQLTHTAWAGEMAGWLKQIPSVRLIAAADLAAPCEVALREWSGCPVSVTERPADARLAELTAQQALQPAPVSLLPVDISSRYRQKFVEGLWIKALSTVALMYLAGVVLYLGMLSFKTRQLDTARANAIVLGKAYTNTIQLGRKVDVLQDQVALKFAALDCWKSVIEALPPELTLVSMNLQKGQKLTLDGTASGDATEEITKFNEKLKESEVNNQKLFSRVQAASIVRRGDTATWRFDADLRRAQNP